MSFAKVVRRGSTLILIAPAVVLVQLVSSPAFAGVAVDAADWAGTGGGNNCHILSSTSVGSGFFVVDENCDVTATASGGSLTSTSSYCKEDAAVATAPVVVTEDAYGCIASLDATQADGFGLNVEYLVRSGEPSTRVCLGGSGSGEFSFVPPPGNPNPTINAIVTLTLNTSGVVTVSGEVVNLGTVAAGPVTGLVYTRLCGSSSVSPSWVGSIGT